MTTVVILAMFMFHVALSSLRYDTFVLKLLSIPTLDSLLTRPTAEAAAIYLDFSVAT